MDTFEPDALLFLVGFVATGKMTVGLSLSRKSAEGKGDQRSAVEKT
jgi:hypothetical protein